MDSDTSTDDVVELQGARIEQVRYHYNSMHNSLSFIPPCGMVRCLSRLLILHLQLMQTYALPGVFVVNTAAIVEDLSEPGTNAR